VRQVTHKIQRYPHAEYKMSFILRREGRGASSTMVSPSV
jgi:hypothetical protein